MTDFSYVQFVRYHHLDFWNPLYLAYLRLLPFPVADMQYRVNQLKSSPIVYYKEVSRS